MFRAITEFKIGWSLSKLPAHIEVLENNIYIKLFKLIGGICLFLIVSGISQQFYILIFYIVFIFSFLYSLYRLILVFYIIKQSIINIYTGKLIVRNSPVNSFHTIFRTLENAAKNTTTFTVGTGVTYAICYELDEILLSEGKEPYFVPGMRGIVKSVGAEEIAKTFLNKLGIRDRIEASSPRSITTLLESMSEEERGKYESETGVKWIDFYNEQKNLQNGLTNFKSVFLKIDKKDSVNTSSISNSIKEYIEKVDPFGKNKK